MAGLPPSIDDDRPATRRDLAKEHELIEAESRAEFAQVRQEMAGGFARVAVEFAQVRQEMAGGFARVAVEFAQVRQEMAEGFAKIRQEMADGLTAVRKEMADGFAAFRAEMATKDELKAEIKGVRRELRILLAVSLTMWGTLAGLIVRGG